MVINKRLLWLCLFAVWPHPPIGRRFAFMLLSLALFFWSVDYGERVGIGKRFTIVAYCAFVLSGLLFVFTDIPATWGWWL